MSNFKNDLSQEHLLSLYLDTVYTSKKIPFTRIYDQQQQHQGMDVLFHVNSKDYMIDEKAQLHYLNQDLPTFTFELSYLGKDNDMHQGWLFDEKKLTHFYFLITGIFLKKDKKLLEHPNDIQQLKITSVNRQKLIDYLKSIGLSKSRLSEYDIDLRTNKTYGKNPIVEFQNQKNGCLYYTEHLAEKPVNLQLQLSHLVDLKIAKTFY